MVKVNIDKAQGNDAVSAARQSRAEKADGKVTPQVEKASSGEDKMQFSGKGAEVGKLVDQVKQFPDVRQDRVESLKEKIAAGEYDPSGEEIADAILRDEE